MSLNVISVILDSNISLSGDLLFGGSNKPSLSPFASNEEKMIQSIKNIINMNVEYNYCGHGDPHRKKDIIRLIGKYL